MQGAGGQGGSGRTGNVSKGYKKVYFMRKFSFIKCLNNGQLCLRIISILFYE